jgi:YggT family protein
LSILCPLLQLYFYVLFARILLSWFPTQPGTFLGQVNDVLRMLTDPVLMPLRRAIPPVRLGGMGLDVSPIILFIGLQLLMSAIGC